MGQHDRIRRGLLQRDYPQPDPDRLAHPQGIDYARVAELPLADRRGNIEIHVEDSRRPAGRGGWEKAPIADLYHVTARARQRLVPVEVAEALSS